MKTTKLFACFWGIVFSLAVIAPFANASTLVLELTDLGPADSVTHAQGTAVVGQTSGAAAIKQGGSTTTIVPANSEANAVSGQWVVGESNSVPPNNTAFRYNSNTTAQQNFPISSLPSRAVDVQSNGRALVSGDAGAASNRSIIWETDNSFSLALPQFNETYPRGFNESGQGIVFQNGANQSHFFDLVDLSTVTLSLTDYDATAGFEGNYTAGLFDTSAPQPAFFEVGDVTPTVLPQLNPGNLFGEVTALNSLGQMVGAWDSEYFLYDDSDESIINLSSLGTMGDNFISLDVPSAINDSGFFYGTGLVETSPGVFTQHAYQGQLIVSIPEPSSAVLVGGACGVGLAFFRTRKSI